MIILVGLLIFSSCASFTSQVRKKTGIDFDKESITKEEVLKLENPEFFELWKKWKPIKFLMTEDEKKLVKEILKIKDEKQRNFYLAEVTKFFWERRDDNSFDDVNEFKEHFYNRVIEAQKKFGKKEGVYTRRCKYGIGWQTDMGLIYIILGEPFDSAKTNVSYLLAWSDSYQDSVFMPQEVEVWYYEVPKDNYDGTLFQMGVAWILFEKDFSGFWEFGEKTFSLFYNYENYLQSYFGGPSLSYSYYIGEVFRFIKAVAKSYIYNDITFEDWLFEKRVKWVPVEKEDRQK